MQDYRVIFWTVLMVGLIGLITIVKRRLASVTGWVVVFSVLLAVDFAGFFLKSSTLVYGAGLLWVLLVVIPGTLGQWCNRLLLGHRYAAAARVAAVIRLLHPADGWRSQPKIIRALELAQKGELEQARVMLRPYQDAKSITGMQAMIQYFRITSQWEEMLPWLEERKEFFQAHSQYLSLWLRALGETGNLRGMVELYEQYEGTISRMNPGFQRDFCRLALFAFTGRREEIQNLFLHRLAVVPAQTQQFWLLTADMHAGRRSEAAARFAVLLEQAEPLLRLPIERRLRQLSLPQSENLEEGEYEAVLQRAVAEQVQDENFTIRRSVFSKEARGTQIIIGLNVLMFLGELGLGGSTDMMALYRLGAMHSPSVYAGEWWRLITAMFLHFGPIHLAMNMFALSILGPFLEFALGFRRFLFNYFLTGIGSMLLVMVFQKHGEDQLTMGASGAVMGVVGATGAIMLRGWLSNRAMVAKRRLVSIFFIIGLQTVFDAMIPEISMTAHLSGALIGFAVTLGLPLRMNREIPGSAR